MPSPLDRAVDRAVVALMEVATLAARVSAEDLRRFADGAAETLLDTWERTE